jgi:putative ABC transport system permease protein
VRSVHERTLEAAPRAAIYRPTMQNPRGNVRLVARVRGAPAAFTNAVKQAIWSVNKDQTITSVTTLDDIVEHAAARPRLVSVLLAAFGALALFLGALGIYGVVAYSVDARRQEIGVRVALGANQRDVVAMIVGRGVALAVAGVAIGSLASLLVTRLMRAVLFDIAPTDPVTYLEVIVGLVGVALLAAYLPARRATRVDATEALRAT